MPYSSELIATMRRLHFYEHYSIHAVSKIVGHHRDTIKRLLYSDSEPRGSETRTSILDPYQDIINEHLERYPSIRATALHRILMDRGYKGSHSTLRRHLKPLRKRYLKSFKPVQCLAGDQAQVDWAHFGSLPVKGGERKLYLFVMVLSWSRAIYAEFTFDMKTDSFLRLHERAFTYFGGSPRKLIYDNLKSAVQERLGKEVRFNKQLSEFAGFYGFVPVACNPYSGHEKGRVERAIRYIRENFASGCQLHSIEQANDEIQCWLRETANQRKWPQGSERVVSQQLEEERELLVTPHDANKYSAKYSISIKSNKYGLVRFDLNDYSTPAEYNRHLLTLEADENKVRFLHDGKVICEHNRCWDRGQRIMTADHWRQQSDKNKQQYRESLLNIVPELEISLKYLFTIGEQKERMLNQFFELYQIYGDLAFKSGLRIAQNEQSYNPQQLSKILVNLEKNYKLQAQRVLFKDQDELGKLHIKSHSLDTYDLF